MNSSRAQPTRSCTVLPPRGLPATTVYACMWRSSRLATHLVGSALSTCPVAPISLPASAAQPATYGPALTSQKPLGTPCIDTNENPVTLLEAPQWSSLAAEAPCAARLSEAKATPGAVGEPIVVAGAGTPGSCSPANVL
jgi:hypothetical protein